MGLFDFFKNKLNPYDNSASQGSSKTTTFQNRLYKKSLCIDSIRDGSVVVLAIAKNDKLLYVNTYSDDCFEYDSDNDLAFKGPIFKIELALINGESFDIIYGVVTDDRESFMMVAPTLLDAFAVNILKELQSKCPGIYNLALFKGAPTRYAYHAYKKSTFCYMTNNFGTDAYFIHFENGNYVRGDSTKIFDLVKSQ